MFFKKEKKKKETCYLLKYIQRWDGTQHKYDPCVYSVTSDILTCSPKIASWMHFDFCNFISELSQVETHCSGERK